MTIVDENLQIVEKDPLEVFESSKRIIYKTIKTFNSIIYLKDDIVSECAVLFWSKCVKEYDFSRGVTIWKYLQDNYFYIIYRISQKERKHQCCQLDESFLPQKVYLDENDISILPFYAELSDEQKQILNLILAGYSYEEIFNKINLPNETKEKKRPIYRRVVEIKTIIAKWYGINYKLPHHS